MKTNKEADNERMLTLAERIINELGISGKLLESWMAQHLAAIVESSSGQTLSNEAQDLILKLWKMKQDQESKQIQSETHQAFSRAAKLDNELLALLRTIITPGGSFDGIKLSEQIICLALLRELERDLLYLWMVARKLDDKFGHLTRENHITILFDNETLVSKAQKRLAPLDPRFNDIGESDLNKLEAVVIDNLCMMNVARLKLLMYFKEIQNNETKTKVSKSKKKRSTGRTAKEKRGS